MTEKIEYAADIRLEISPFRTITLDQSIFIQRNYWEFAKKIRNAKGTKIEYLQELNSTTISESMNKDHWVQFKYDHVLISKYVPALSYEKGIKVEINNTMVEGVKIKMGDFNKLL